MTVRGIAALALCAGATLATLAAVPVRQLPSDFSRRAIVDTLEAYAQGQQAEAVGYLERVAAWAQGVCRYYGVDASVERAFEEIGRRYAVHAGRWILEAPATERPRRRRVAAVVALEIANLAPPAASGGSPCVAWAHVRPPVEWACQTLRDGGPPTEFERVWHHAAFGLIERAQDGVFMAGGEPAAQRERDHATHAIDRFPDDARFRLAPLLARAELQVIGNRPAPPTTTTAQTFYRPRPIDRARLDETLAALDALARTHESIASEARLRAGVLRFLLDDMDRSLSDLEAAAFGASDFSRYVAGMVAALIHDRRGHADRAIQALRQAVAAVPGTQTARLALAARLRAAGSIAEAGDLAEAAVLEPPAADPWRLYGVADYRDFTTHLDALRAAVR
jgi:hypothetical protein